MRLSGLQFIDEKIEYSPAELRAYELERLQPEITPLSPEWGATIYYDREKFPNAVTIERIERHYAEEYPGREFGQREITLQDLRHFAIAKYPLAEERFRRRGFVSDIEVTSFQKKDHHPETTYLALNKAATYFQLASIAQMMRGPLDDAGDTEGISVKLARLIDGHRVRRRDGLVWIPAPLIERDGVFHVGSKLQENEIVHFAHRWLGALAVDDGMRDAFGLCHAMPDEIAVQIRFEYENSEALFNGVSSDTLLLWQEQVIAVLRKAVWEIELRTGVPFTKQEAEESKARAKALKGLLSSRRVLSAGKIDSALEAVLNDHQDAYRSAMSEENAKSPIYGSALGTETYHHGITTDQNVVAALHGATYQPEFDWDDSNDRSDPLHWLKPVAEWIGRLKRHRHVVLTAGIAECLWAIFGECDPYADYDPRLQGFSSVIEDRLGEVAWSVIADAIPEVLNSGSPVSVVYDWTRNAGEPWAAERREDGTIVIRGPLLDFPVSRAAYWKEKASIIMQ